MAVKVCCSFLPGVEGAVHDGVQKVQHRLPLQLQAVPQLLFLETLPVCLDAG